MTMQLLANIIQNNEFNWYLVYFKSILTLSVLLLEDTTAHSYMIWINLNFTLQLATLFLNKIIKFVDKMLVKMCGDVIVMTI